MVVGPDEEECVIQKGVEVCLAGHGKFQFPESRAGVVWLLTGGILPCNMSMSLRRRYESAAPREPCSCRLSRSSLVSERSGPGIRFLVVRRPHLQRAPSVGPSNLFPLLRR